MKRKSLLLSLFVIITSLTALAQRPGGPGGGGGGQMPADGSVQGKVIDAQTGQSVEYANIVLYAVRDSSMAYGGISDNNGYFKLENIRYGKYYVEVKFIGYDRKLISDITLNFQNKEAILGRIEIEPAYQSLPEATVTAREVPVEYHIDKKVVNVAQDMTSTGNTAVEVLENIPSIQTDIDGNVTLRGSTSFTVLVDGRPTILQGTEALEQIPATTIDKVEIITNPSAKYDPEGVAGIINVILKKNKQQGVSGVLDLNAARGPSYGGNLLLTYRTGKFNIIGSASYDIDNHPGTQVMTRETMLPGDTSFFYEKDMDRNRAREGWNFRLGAEYEATPNDMFIFQFGAGKRGFNMSMDAHNHEYYLPGGFDAYNVNNASFEHGHLNGRGSVYYEHRFNGSKHRIENDLRFSFGDQDDRDMNEIYDADANYVIIPGLNGTLQRTNELGFEYDLEFKSDYTNDMGSKGKIEAGVEVEVENENSGYRLENYDHDLAEWVTVDTLTNDMELTWNIYSAYGTYSSKLGKLGYMAGLRAEYVDRLIYQVNYDEKYPVNRLDFFPSLHLSYDINQQNQLMASYSRRIRRPRGWSLNPYPFYVDEYTTRVGNPALEPEYANSYELSYLRRFGGSFVSLEAYRRETMNVMNRVVLVSDDGHLTYTEQNLDRDYSTGLELSANLELYKWWRLNLSGTYYNYRITGQLVDSEVNQVTNTWRANASTSFILPKATRIQLSSFYVGPSVTAQGERDGFYGVNLAVRQDFLKRRLSVTLNVRDLFDTMEHSFTAYGSNFTTSMLFDNLGPIYSINLSYRINNYKQDERSRMNGNGNGGDMEDIF